MCYIWKQLAGNREGRKGRKDGALVFNLTWNTEETRQRERHMATLATLGRWQRGRMARWQESERERQQDSKMAAVPGPRQEVPQCHVSAAAPGLSCALPSLDLERKCHAICYFTVCHTCIKSRANDSSHCLTVAFLCIMWICQCVSMSVYAVGLSASLQLWWQHNSKFSSRFLFLQSCTEATLLDWKCQVSRNGRWEIRRCCEKIGIVIIQDGGAPSVRLISDNELTADRRNSLWALKKYPKNGETDLFVIV